MMTRKDFEHVAESIRKMPPAKRLNETALWVNRFRDLESHFNEVRFREACLGKKSPKSFPSVPSFVQRRNCYQVCFADFVDWKDLGKDIKTVTVNGQVFDFETLVVHQIYSKSHQWAGQLQGSWVNIKELYRIAFNKPHRIGTYRDWDGVVGGGSQSMNLCDFFAEMLFQIEAYDTNACTNLMGPWIAYEVEQEFVIAFEKDLARHIEVLQSMTFSLLP